MSTPKVSVIIPVYNVEPYIERCARSLFEQTLEEIEYIFVNDCTPDASMRILQNVLEDYAQRKNQIIIINQPYNMGAAKAREDGIKAAQGEYIIHCDSDDWVDKEMYRTMYEKAVKSRLDCVLCRSIYYTDGSSHKMIKYTFKEDKMKFLAELIYGRASVSLCNRLVKRDIYQLHNFIYPTYHMMEDRVYSIQISYYAQSHGCVDSPFYYYYQRSDSVCGNTSNEGMLRNFHQASVNFAIIEHFLREKKLLSEYKDALFHFEFVVRGFLIPLLKKNNKYRRLWMNSFHRGISRIWLSRSIPWMMKVISFFIIVGTYPTIYKLSHIRRKLTKQNKEVMTWNNIQYKLRMLMFDCYQILIGKIDKNISIFCNNCIGAFVAHDFRLPFNSPTVNLMIPPSDFIEYIANLEYYTNAPIEPTKSDQSWPIALLGGKVHIHLIHYKTVEEGVLAWRRQETRINAKRMYFVLIETDGCTYEDLERFDQLPYKNKVALTHKSYPQIKCAHYIKGYENQNGVIDSYRFHKILPLRIYDQFNWMKFLKHRNV